MFVLVVIVWRIGYTIQRNYEPLVQEQISEFKAAGEAYAKQKAEWALLKDAKTVTADGKHFELAANIGTPKDVEGVNENGAEAVGLYRTEHQ